MTRYGKALPILLAVLTGASPPLAAPRMTTDGPTRVSPAAANPARPAEAASATPVSRFRWPLDGAPRLVRRFDPPPQPWSPGHRGVDLAAPPGAVVRAAGDGVVLFVGRIAGRGVVSVQHAGGLRSTYEPVGSGVTAGARVTAGAPLGVLAAGHPGCPAPACLHWGLRRGASYLDPLFLLGLGRVRLLPLSAARRAVGAGAGPAAHSRRRGCRPGRRGGASPDRPTR